MENSKCLIGIAGKANSGKDLVGKIIQYLTARKDDNRSIKIQTAEFLGLTSQNWMAIYQAQNWEIKKFADKLKDIVCLLIGCTRQQLEDREFKEKELGEEWWYWSNTALNICPKEYGTFPNKMYGTKKEADKARDLYTLDRHNLSHIVKPTPRILLQQIGTDLFRNQLHPNTWVNATFADYKSIGDTLLEGEVRRVREEDLIYPNWIITDVRFPNELEAIKKHNGITIRINRGLVERTGKMIQEPEHISETALDNAEFDYVIENDCTIDDLIEKVREILIKENIIND